MTLPKENPQDQRMMGDFDAFMRSVQNLLRRYENGGAHDGEIARLLSEIETTVERLTPPLLPPTASAGLRARFPFNRFPVLHRALLRLRDLWRIDQSAQHLAIRDALFQLRRTSLLHDRALGDLQAAVARMVPFGRDGSIYAKPTDATAVLRQWRDAFWRTQIPETVWTAQRAALKSKLPEVFADQAHCVVVSGAWRDSEGHDLAGASLAQVQGGLPGALYRLPKAGYDAVLAFPPLDIDMEDLPQLLLEAARLLRPGGWLVLSDALPLSPAERDFFLAQAGFEAPSLLPAPAATEVERETTHGLRLALLLCRRNTAATIATA